MSKYFAFINKEPYDFVFNKHPNKGWYYFKVGKYPICQLAPKYYTRTNTIKAWTVIVSGHVDKQALRMVHGFATRHDAVDYALQVHELTKEQYTRCI